MLYSDVPCDVTMKITVNMLSDTAQNKQQYIYIYANHFDECADHTFHYAISKLYQ